jgi:hypothetical protein
MEYNDADMREATLGLAPLLGKGIFNLKGF